MPRMKLTKQAVHKLPAPDPSGKQHLYWDTEQKGFGLLVSGKTETKSYVVQREVNGRTRRVTLGTVVEFDAAEKTIDDVRKQAADLVHETRKGKDPKAHRGPAANATLREILDDYISFRTTLSERSQTNYRKTINRWLKGWLNRPLREITPDMVEKRFREIKEEVANHKAKRKVDDDDRPNRSAEPGAASANGAMRALRALWNFAADRVPELPPNPVGRLKKNWYPVPPRERYVSGDQLPAFYKAVSALPSRTMRDYILLLLFTGLRRNEAASLRWTDIDFAQKVIRLPARRTKAKRKLDLPMSDFVHDLLVVWRKLGIENDYVFPGDRKTGHLSEPKKVLTNVGTECGVRVSPHDLRRTFITVASRCRIAPQELKALVNHSLGGDVTEGYSQLATSDLAEAMQIVTDRMKELCKVQPIGDEGSKAKKRRG